jgi:hypothetical protein
MGDAEDGTGRQQAKLYTEEKKFIAVISVKDCPATLGKRLEISKFEKRVNKATAVKLDLDSPVKLNCAMKDEKQQKAFASLVKYLHKQKKSARIGVENGDLLLVAPSDGSVKVLRCFFRPGPTRKSSSKNNSKPAASGANADEEYKRFADAMKKDKSYKEAGNEQVGQKRKKSRWDNGDGGGQEVPPPPPPPLPPMGGMHPEAMMGSPHMQGKGGMHPGMGGKGMMQPDMGKGMHDMGKGMNDMGKGMNDMGKGMNDMGKGMNDMGKGMNDMGKGMHDMGKGMYDMGGKGMHDMGKGMYDMGGKGMYDMGKGMYDMGKGMHDMGKGGKGYFPPPGGGQVFWPPGQAPPPGGMQGMPPQPPLPPPPLPQAQAPLPPQPPQPPQPAQPAVDRKPGDWDCPKCAAVCYATRTMCFKCSTHNPNQVPANDEGDVEMEME